MKANECDGSLQTRQEHTDHTLLADGKQFRDLPYPGITRDTCEKDGSYFHGEDVILVDDIYTKNINVAEDRIQTLYDFGAKRVIMYAIAKTRE